MDGLVGMGRHLRNLQPYEGSSGGVCSSGVGAKSLDKRYSRNSSNGVGASKPYYRQAVQLTVGVHQPRDGHDTDEAKIDRNQSAG